MQKERALVNPILVMTMLKEAKRMDLVLEYSDVETYIFLMKSKGIPFSYNFHLYPLPVSDELGEDLLDLKRAGMIDYSSPVVLTEEGETYLSDWTIPNSLSTSMNNAIVEFQGYDQESLFRALYTTAVS